MKNPDTGARLGMLLSHDPMPGTREAEEASQGTSQVDQTEGQKVGLLSTFAIFMFGAFAATVALCMLIGFKSEWLPRAILWLTE